MDYQDFKSNLPKVCVVGLLCVNWASGRAPDLVKPQIPMTNPISQESLCFVRD